MRMVFVVILEPPGDFAECGDRIWQRIDAIVVLLVFTGVINIHGGGGKDINVKVEAPKVEAPAAPAKPAAPAPANGG